MVTTRSETGEPLGLVARVRRVLTATSVVILLSLSAAPLAWVWNNWVAGPTFAERHQAEAEAICRLDPETKFRKYPLADGTDPAPDLDAFEYCVAAYISHLPSDD